MSPCVLDTDVIIAALDRADAHHGDAARAIQGMTGAGTTLLVSSVNYAEALVRPAQDERAFNLAVDAIAALGIRAVAPSDGIARDAARIRGRGVSLPDGFALATARARHAAVASFDQRVRRAMDELAIPAPTELSG